MDDEDAIRAVLLSLLMESQVRLAGFAKFFPGHFVGPVFASLATQRLTLFQDVIQQYPDAAFIDGIAQEGFQTGLSVAFQEAELGAKGDEVAATETVIAAESDLQIFLEDMPAETVDADLRRRALALVAAGIERLRAARDQTRSLETRLTFSTKSDARDIPGTNVPVYDVWFGSNRTPIAGGESLEFSDAMAAQTTLGRCSVTVPVSHRIGQVKPAFWRRLILGEQPMRVVKVTPLESTAFWDDVREALSAGLTEPGDALVFLHGYRVSFEAAALCAAQIGADLNVPGGLTAFFSWPSKGKYFGYAADEATIEASEVAITDFLEAFAANSGARRVNIIAHSMGNRGLLRAVNRIAATAARRTGKPFGQIVLAAPDVDTRTFQGLHQAYDLVAEGTTLYVSNKDFAVWSSRAIHAANRLGYTPPVTVLPGIDTISVSKVDLSWLGHGYVADCRTILTDLHQLLVSGVRPDKRAGMVKLVAQDGEYWELSA